MIHILPLSDSDEHYESTTCHCEPNVIEEGGTMICIHNAFDGREGVEIAQAILDAV